MTLVQYCVPVQLLMFEYAVVGMWCYAGVVTGYNSYTANSSTADIYYDTFAASLLSIYQVLHSSCVNCHVV